MATKELNKDQVNELLYQALETEVGGVQVYKTALRCAVNEDLKEEWQKYLEQTQNHERVMRELFEKMGLDPEADTPGRQVVRHIGESLVKAMKMALGNGHPEGAQIVAAECVVEAETKDQLNWELRAPNRMKPFWECWVSWRCPCQQEERPWPSLSSTTNCGK